MIVSDTRTADVDPKGPLFGALRFIAGTMVILSLAFLINAVAILWWGWPGALETLGALGIPGFGTTSDTPGVSALGIVQLLTYIAPIVTLWIYIARGGSLVGESRFYAAFAAFIIRAAFWSALLIGLADAIVSFLRVEELLAGVVGEALSSNLNLSTFRGSYVHYPLMVLSLIIAALTRSLSFVWLALLVVLAEFQIVISRFVFSYEQAFMGDLVRFWYSGLFLIASAYTLIDEGHVRVDVVYARLSDKARAWSNVAGCILLGFPLCWTILLFGMWSRGSSLTSPLLSFEISQSGYGMYVKYLMAGLLVVFAVSMIVQFAGYLLSNAAVLGGARPERAPTAPEMATE